MGEGAEAVKKQFTSILLSGASAVWLASPSPAVAQVDAPKPAVANSANAQASAANDASGTNDQSEVVVTGSRIVRDGYTAPTPVTVATTEELAKTTPSSVPDALNKLPQFSNSLSPSKSANNFSNLPIHGNVLNLRGLGTPSNNPKGPLRTLILFDGIRVSPTEYVGTVDTNVLPELLMQRVDVVTGGASAQWGSDAVAGVVNFVLDKKFTGFKGVAQAGTSQRGDNGNQRLGAAWGSDFAGGRGHIELSGEYTNNEGMLRRDRDFSTKGYNFVGSVTSTCTLAASGQSRTCTAAPGTAANPYIVLPDIRISALAANGRITAASNAGNPFVGQVINNDGSTRPFNLGTAVGTTGFQQGGDGYAIPTDTNAIAPLRNYSGFGRVSYEVTDGITAFAQGLYARSQYHYFTQGNSLVPPSEAATIYKGNPYLSSALNAALPTANDYYTVGQQDAGQPKPIAREQTDYWMVTAGLDGKISGLNWQLAYTHGDSVHNMANSGLYDNRKLYAALDVVTNPANGQPTCRVLLDPNYASQYAGCQPLDVLHGDPSKSTPAGYAYATGTSRYRATFRQDSVTANLNGSLFELPAGPVDFAVGAEYRHQSLLLTSNADPALLSGSTAAETAALRAQYFAGLRGVPATALFYWLTNVGSGAGSLNVKEAYGELAVPILKDVPFFRELSANGAVRVTDYSTSGTVATWKVGGTWKPIPEILLRGTYSHDIRAPNLYELYAGPQSGIGIVNDVQNAAKTYGSGDNVNANTVTSGNPNLKPEKANTYTFGGVFSPGFLPGFSAAIDYYHIKVSGLIDSLSAQQILTNCLNAGGSGAPECALIDRASPTSFPSLVRLTPANIAFLTTSGIDFDVSYRAAVGSGALGIRLYANYLDKFDAQQYTGAPISHYAGVSVVGSNPQGFPRWRANLTVDYTNGPLGITFGEQYIGKMRLDIPGGSTPIQFVDPNVKPVWFSDLTLRYTVPSTGGNFEFFTTVNNLFDKQPPIIPGTVPGVNPPTNIALYDIVGRAFTFGARVKF